MRRLTARQRIVRYERAKREAKRAKRDPGAPTPNLTALQIAYETHGKRAGGRR